MMAKRTSDKESAIEAVHSGLRGAPHTVRARLDVGDGLINGVLRVGVALDALQTEGLPSPFLMG